MAQKLSPEQKQKRAKFAVRDAKTRRSSVLILVALFIVFIGWANIWKVVGLAGYGYITSTGSRVGQVTQLSHSGVVWKTWEGTLALTQNGSVAENWLFSIDDFDPQRDQKVTQLKYAVDFGSVVKLSYEKHFGIQSWHAKTMYTITDIEVLSLNGEQRLK